MENLIDIQVRDERRQKIQEFRDNCLHGNIDKVRSLINESVHDYKYDYDDGLIYTCIGGHQNIATMLITNGAKNLEQGLSFASMADKIDMVTFIINKGAKHYHNALLSICQQQKCNMKIFDILEKKMIDEKRGIDWEDLFFSACKGGSLDLINYLITKTNTFNWTEGILITQTYLGDHEEVAVFLALKGGDIRVYNRTLKNKSLIAKLAHYCVGDIGQHAIVVNDYKQSTEYKKSLENIKLELDKTRFLINVIDDIVMEYIR